MPRSLLSFLVVTVFALSCSSSNKTTGTATTTSLLFKDYRIEKNAKQDSALVRMLQPYTASLGATMNKTIGTAAKELSAKRGEGSLANFMADCMQLMAEKKFERKVDAGFMNPGGIRSSIPAGNITVGKIYELMPFDNLVVLQEVRGTVLQAFLNKTAEDGGWAISANMRMNIKNRKAVNVTINNKALDENATYVIANSDYVASGGDNCEMLRKVPMISSGYVFRDALSEFIGNYTRQGKAIDYTTEKRVNHVD